VVSNAYHLPLSKDSHLSFGLSLGFMNERISEEDLKGDAGDEDVSSINQQDIYTDGDFGISYTSNTFNIQAAC